MHIEKPRFLSYLARTSGNVHPATAVRPDGQMRIDQMVMGHRAETVAGRKRGRAARRQRWDQQQLPVGSVSTSGTVRSEEGSTSGAVGSEESGTSGAVREEGTVGGVDSTGGDERPRRLGREDRQQRSGRKRSQPPETRERAKKSKKSSQSSSVASAPSDGTGQVARQSVRLITELLARTDVGIEGPEPIDTG